MFTYLIECYNFISPKVFRKVSAPYANALLPLLAYNHAAKNHRRRQEIFKTGCTIAVGVSLAVFLVYELFAPHADCGVYG